MVRPSLLAAALIMLALAPLSTCASLPGCKTSRLFPLEAHSDHVCVMVEGDRGLHCTLPGFNGLKNVQMVAMSWTAQCVLHLDGTVSCTGDPSHGQLGLGQGFYQELFGSYSYQNGERYFVPSLYGTLQNVYTWKSHVLTDPSLVVTSISANKQGFCALYTNGQASCWGDNSKGQLGNDYGEYEYGGEVGLDAAHLGKHIPKVNVGTNRTIVQLVSLPTTNCALLDNHEVKCWGECDDVFCHAPLGEFYSFLGAKLHQLGDRLPSIDLGQDVHAVFLAAGYDHLCALLNNTRVKCWGQSDPSALGWDAPNSTVMSDGFIGDGLPYVKYVDEVTNVACGWSFTCLVVGGRAKCFGANDQKQLGYNDRHYRGDGSPPPYDMANLDYVDVPGNIVAIAAGSAHVAVLLDSGYVFVWGSSFSFLSNEAVHALDLCAPTTPAPTFKSLHEPRVSVCAPGFATCVKGSKVPCLTNLMASLDNCGACGVSVHRPYPNGYGVGCYDGKIRVQCNPGYFDCDQDISNGCESQYSCAPTASPTTFERCQGLAHPVSRVFSGGSATLEMYAGLKPGEGTQDGFCAVLASSGRLQCTPGQAIDITGLYNVSAVARNMAAVCVVRNGQVSCAGVNVGAALGDGQAFLYRGVRGEGSSYYYSPEYNFDTQVNLYPGWDVQSLVATAGSFCALYSNGQVSCWGQAWGGAVGNGKGEYEGFGNVGFSSSDMGANLAVVNLGSGGRTSVALAGSARTVCSVLDNGQVKCWGICDGILCAAHTSNVRNKVFQWETGWDSYAYGSGYGVDPGQMGNHLPAIDLGSGVYAVDIAGGANHFCALLNSSQVKCWGYGDQGQLGWNSNRSTVFAHGFVGDGLPFVQINEPVASVSCGSEFTCVLLSGGKVKCFGFGGDYSLGYPDSPNNRGNASLAPYDMASLPYVPIDGAVISITCSYASVAALLDSGELVAWGHAVAHSPPFYSSFFPGHYSSLPSLPSYTGQIVALDLCESFSPFKQQKGQKICAAGWGNCKPMDQNCTTNLLVSSSNCGKCGVNALAKYPHGKGKGCSRGHIRLVCDKGHYNCDQDATNGCEAIYACTLQPTTTNQPTSMVVTRSSFSPTDPGPTHDPTAFPRRPTRSPISSPSAAPVPGACHFERPHAQVIACIDGAPLLKCEVGFYDCDGLYYNGCEADQACGSSTSLLPSSYPGSQPSSACSTGKVPHGVISACTNGVPVVQCKKGFYNCDGKASNGCESKKACRG